jgi:hypothetical protein
MAIKKDNTLSTEEEAVLRIDNGDLKALKVIQSTWNLKDLESAIIFAVGVLRFAEDTKKVFVEQVGQDKPVPITPSEKLLRQEETPPSDHEKVS